MIKYLLAPAFAIGLAWVSSGVSAQTLNTLVTFNGTDGSSPAGSGSLIADAAGNLYGTTHNGGAFPAAGADCPFGPAAAGCGTVFKIAKTATGYATTPTTLYNFCSQSTTTITCADGATPSAGLIFDANGNLFGTTTFGGAARFGTIFEIKADPTSPTGYASTPIILTSFCSREGLVGGIGACKDGTDPLAPLIMDAAGNLFGTSVGGGINCVLTGGCGTAFELPVDTTTPTGYASVIAATDSGSFTGGVDGKFPFAGLFMDPNGNVFGTNSQGGTGCASANCGTVFEFVKNQATGTYSGPVTLFGFNGTNGIEPLSNLISDASGNLYGTALGGPSGSFGVVYEIKKDSTTTTGYATSPTVLVTFNATDGATPESGLLMDAAGNLFGTTIGGGANNLGAVYEVKTDPTTLTGYANAPTLLVSFDTTDANPFTGLIADASGNLFGATGGGTTGHGTVFEITGSGFVTTNICGVVPTAGMANCIGETNSCLAHTYGGVAHAAAMLGYSSVGALQIAVSNQCSGS